MASPSPEAPDEIVYYPEVVEIDRDRNARDTDRPPPMESGLIRAWTPYRPGDIVSGKYRMERSVWQGDLLCVIQARHLVLEQRATLKYLRPEARAFPETIANFLRDARTLLQLRTEHVTPVLDVGILELGTPYVALQWPDGLQLSQIMRVRGPLPIDEAADYITQIATGVAAAHALGLHHGGLNPSNVVITKRSDGSPLACVTDFGGANDSTFVATHEPGVPLDTLPDTLRYLSPDHARTPDSLDARADVWALGAIFHELLAGTPVYQSPNFAGLLTMIAADPPTRLRDLRSDVPATLERIVLCCLEKNREHRFADASQVLMALRNWRAAEQASTTRRSRAGNERQSEPPLEREFRHSGIAVRPMAVADAPRIIDSSTRPSSVPSAPRPAMASSGSRAGWAAAIVIGAALMTGGLIRYMDGAAAGPSASSLDSAQTSAPTVVLPTVEVETTTPEVEAPTSEAPPAEAVASTPPDVVPTPVAPPAHQPATTPIARPVAVPVAKTASTPKPPAAASSPSRPPAAESPRSADGLDPFGAF